jgi:elongation factor G
MTILKTSTLQNLRNIGIAAHVDAGKTTVTERILFYTGRIHSMGEVHHGTATTDSMPEEQKRGITISAAAISTTWKDHAINIIDTPGHVDFTIEVERSMRVLDGAVAVFDSSQGVEPQSETVWRQADRYGVPRIAFANKMDKVGASFELVLSDMRERLGAVPAPVQYPMGQGSDFAGILDLLELKAWVYQDDAGLQLECQEIPSQWLPKALEMRQILLETIAEFDDELLQHYLEGNEVSTSQMQQALRKGTLEQKIFPVLCGSALKNRGIQPLLDAVVAYLPSPLEVDPLWGLSETGAQVPVPADAQAALVALAFKIVSDPFGRLTFVRVYSGTLRNGSYLQNTTLDKRERVGRLLKIQAGKREEVSELQAGDLGAIIGLKEAGTGHTLVGENDPWVQLESIKVPPPVMTLAIAPKTKSDQDRLGLGLSKLVEEDPTFSVTTDADSGQTIIAGMGELHLEIVLDRLLREHKVEVDVGAPQVAYRETVTRNHTLEGRFVQQNGGNGQFGVVTLRLEPLGAGEGFQFVNALVGGSIPKEFHPAVKKGVEKALDCGPLCGYPVVDLKVTLLEGKYHPTDSSSMAFEMAAGLAMQEGMTQAKPQLLEPMMQVEVTVPDDYLGSLIGDLNSRRGRILALEARGNAQIIKAAVPLAEMFGYAMTMRSLSQGRANYSMTLSHYAAVPVQVAAKLTIS